MATTAPDCGTDATHWATILGVWIGVGAGLLTALGALYGLYQTWQARREERNRRLLDAAAVAVRKAEAAYVRPVLRQKLDAVVRAWITEWDDRRREREESPTARMLLFCQLQRCVGLDDGEKSVATETAVGNLLGALRTMPSPPLSVPPESPPDGLPPRVHGRLRELVEGAYHMRQRPSALLIRELNHFCPPSFLRGGGGAAGVVPRDPGDLGGGSAPAC